MPLSRAYVFDAYGTLFDVMSATARLKSEVGPEADRIGQLWRTKQLEYTWTRSLGRRHRDFAGCTADALDWAVAMAGGVKPGVREKLLSAYRTLDAYSEVASVLGEMKRRGAKLAILSNGTPAMLADAVSSAGLSSLLDAVISIEEAGIFKPDPSVYQLVLDRLGIAKTEVSFQSSNAWDAAFAKAFGFRVVWINRTSAPAEYADLKPDRTIAGLKGLLED